ncbi:hypothetical protein DASC09_002200 [Saccharomycopsis crataegensis]|uniref:Sphingolipid delta(4)-desaturase n=1 Tax=Saccharomycopsis crataegensis TaxID=43959 RepID=A0AAV5QEL6_9ASCO|nr:hypothetical protein DASC09_002200 [Saccharomycopsis crataegensis]
MSETIHHKPSNKTIDVRAPVADINNLRKLNDFYWTDKKEPHTYRRKEILRRHPEVSKLTGHEPLTKYIIFCVVSLQFFCAYSLRNTPVFSFKFLSIAYLIGATANQNCFLAIHEMSHNLAFKEPLHNQLYSIVANLPIGIPYSASFKPYHQLHHKFLGDVQFDTDLPTRFEAIFLSNIFGKAFFATFQLFFYALRPMFITSVKFTIVHFLNVLVQVLVDYVMVEQWGVNSLYYFLISSFLAGSLHPCAGHFISEHYILNPPTSQEYIQSKSLYINTVMENETVPPPETYSYYGILNFFTWNVGLHNEHHDFPYVAWSKLFKLNEIANEFYEPLPKTKSWAYTIVDFVCNKDITLWNRVKRDLADAKAKEKVDLNVN